MRLKTSRFATRAKEIKYRTNWHQWFAWHPVTIAYGKAIWLETIERRTTRWGGPDGHWYIYREVQRILIDQQNIKKLEQRVQALEAQVQTK